MKLQTLLLFCLMVLQGVLHAQKVSIDNLTTTTITTFDKRTETSEPITAAYLQKNDLHIYIKKTLKISKVERKNLGTIPDILKIDTDPPVLSDYNKYVIVRDKNFKDKKIELLLTPTKGKAVTVTIEMAESNAAEQDGQSIVDCKLEKLKAIRFRFISDDLYQQLEQKCPPFKCDTCPDNTNTLVYDFAENTLRYNGNSRNKRVVKVGDPVAFRIKNANPYLYNVTITDTLLDYNLQTSPLLDLLEAANAIKGLESVTPTAKDGDCPLTLNDSLAKAITDLQMELARIQKHMRPYVDAACLMTIMEKMRAAVNASLNNYFGSRGISSFTALMAYLAEHEDAFPGKNLEGLETAYNQLMESHFGYYYKVPVVKDVDGISFRFNILPKDGSLALPMVKDGEVIMYTKGGFKIDVSTGLFYATDLRDREFVLRPDSINRGAGFEPRQRIIPEEQGRGEFGFSSFFHFYPRTGGIVNVAGSIGAGLSFTEKPSPRYFGGLSLLIGRDNRVALTGGVAMGYVRKLSSRYSLDASGEYNLLPEDAGTLQYKRQFWSSGFFSLSYNLRFVNRKQQAQVIEAPAVAEEPETKNGSGKEDEADTGNEGEDGGTASPGTVKQQATNLVKKKVKEVYSKVKN
jgi:hypothetical protein